MNSNELKMKLLLLGFTPNDTPFDTQLIKYALDDLSVFHSIHSDNWFHLQTAYRKGSGTFYKPSKRVSAEIMHTYILKKLGIENG